MPANRQWIQRNLGYDPVATPVPPEAFAFKEAAKPEATPEDFQREIIDFDSEGAEGREFLTLARTATGLSKFTPIPWPDGLAPMTGKKPDAPAGAPLPQADVLVVTWTVDEGHALSRVLTPGKDSRNDYVPYTHNFAAFAEKMSPASPAREAGRLGAYWTTKIGNTTALILKSDSHLSQDTKKLPQGNGTLPNYDFWKQIIGEVRPKLVLTTGTAGGIGPNCEVGDVILSPIVRYDGLKWLKSAAYHDAEYESSAPKTKYLEKAIQLFAANQGQLPKDNKRPPAIVQTDAVGQCVVTTDFFGFDTSDDHYQLQGLGAVSEMGDAVLGQVSKDLPAPPRWLAVRNVSDPQIESTGTLQDQAKIAAQIYKGFGRWSSVCSAIVCWALIAAE